MNEIFKLLSDENRLKIFTLLLFNELCICDLEEHLSLKQANVSKHMMAFKKLNVVETRKDAQWVYYKLSDSFINEHQDLVTYVKNKAVNNPLYNELINRCSCACQKNNC